MQIAQWKAAGYFTGPTAVMMRKASQLLVSEKRALDAGDEPGSKKAKTGRVERSSHQELENDFDGDGDDSDDGLTIAEIMAKDRKKKEEKLKVEQQQQQIDNSPQAAPPDVGIGSDWILSDDIDFGEFSLFKQSEDEEGSGTDEDE